VIAGLDQSDPSHQQSMQRGALRIRESKALSKISPTEHYGVDLMWRQITLFPAKDL